MSRKIGPILIVGALGLACWGVTLPVALGQPMPLPPPAGGGGMPAPGPGAPLPAPYPSPSPYPPTANIPPAPLPTQPYHPLNRFYYYPYYYFPHNYWPTMSPQWPEPPGACYQRPPAYMAFPPFREPHWRYEYWEPQNYYRGSHFWLDVF